MRLVALLALGSIALPAAVAAQVDDLPTPPAAYLTGTVPTVPVASPLSLTGDERERLLARTGDELASEPIPADITARSLELAVVQEQREAIDLRGINALQWVGGCVMIVGGGGTVFSFLIGGLIALLGGPSAVLVYGTLIGLSAVALGGIVLGLAELDGNLHRRRELDSRARRLRGAPIGSVGPYYSGTGVGLVWSASF